MKMDPGQVRALARDKTVSLTGCNNVEQWKQRLILHLKVQRGIYFDVQREFGVRKAESPENTRHQLHDLFNMVKDAVADLEKNGLEEVLVGSNEDGQPKESLVKQIESRTRALRSSQCSVIVAGETNAGKSTFLNLLLGMDILPVHIFSCTAAICVLRYAPTFSADIQYSDGSTTTKAFADVDEARTWMNDIVAEKDEGRREVGLGLEAIYVKLPAVILQSGVTLVDTPGIGENEAMTSCTLEYVKKNSAAAYIYVIKTDNAGGVHDDRILEFLRAILEYNKRQDNVSEFFDPSAAMFVCNRWDQVPVEQREGVKDNALRKLKDVWPNFEPSQAFFVSAVNSAIHLAVDQRFVTKDLETVFIGLKEVFGKTRHNAINHHYRWLKHLLHQCTTSLQTTLYNCSQTDDDLINSFNKTRTKLTALQTRTTDTMKTVKKYLLAEINQLINCMATILKEEPVRAGLKDWTCHPIPANPTLGGGLSRSNSTTELSAKFKEREQMQRWQHDLDTMIMRRILDTVDDEVRLRKLDTTLQENVKKLLKDQLKLVDDEINSILQDMKDRDSLNSSVSSSASCMSLEEDEDQVNANEMLRLYHERRAHNGLPTGLRHVSRLTEANRSLNLHRAHPPEAALATVPKVLRDKMLKPVIEMMKNFTARRRQSAFTTDPAFYMGDRAEKLVQVVCGDRLLLEQLAFKYHDRLDHFIQDVDNSIPRFIANNKQLIGEILNNRRKYLNQKDTIFAVMEKMEPIRELLRGFGSLYIRDVTADNVFFTLDAEQRRESVAVSVHNIQSNVRQQSQDSGIMTDLDASTRSFRNLGDSFNTGTNTTAAPGGGVRPTFVGLGASTMINSPSSKKTTQGLWSTYRQGHVEIGKNTQPLIGRSYLQGLSDHSLIKEIARLRGLRSPSLAPFLGMSRVEDCGGAVFLFLGDMMSARRYLSKAFHEPRESVPRLLEGVLQGLVYLHRERLVHMELTLDTVMVCLEGNVQLCGACLPRVARFPPDADQVNTEPFVCLSPEVLRGELYTADDDYYSFGLVVWETCLPGEDKPFALQRDTMSLAQFRTSVHPSSMLLLDAKEHLTPPLARVLRGCLLPARGLRLKADALKEQIAELRSDPIVQSLSSVARRHRPVVSRHHSDDARDLTLSSQHQLHHPHPHPHQQQQLQQQQQQQPEQQQIFV